MSPPISDDRALTASRIREARKLAGLTQAQVARFLSMHRPTVSEIEAGNRRVSSDEIAQLSKLFDVSVGWLVGEVSAQIESDDPRVQLAARELNRLKPQDLDRLLKLFAAIRSDSNEEL
ncbi:MAG: helix-turn-helix transcriptional regulator [Gammaproteobacteria bacterium]|nr:helix-turn-helix transcriptional regulator [Gammaproteobacteria bacterium]